MKFLVLALCVCAASAASFGGSFGAGGYKNFGGYQSKFKATPSVTPAVVPAPVVPAPVVPVPIVPVEAPVVVAAKAVASSGVPVYSQAAEAGLATYSAAKEVVNKPYTEEGQAAILRSESDISPEGYRFVYETANGITAESVGTYKQVGEEGAVVSQGSYKYIAPDGTPVLVTYIADENGYQPQSELLPVGPEIPEAIVRALAYTAAKTAKTAQQN